MAAAGVAPGSISWSTLKTDELKDGIRAERLVQLQFDGDLTLQTLLKLRNFMIACRLATTREEFVYRVLAPCVVDASVNPKIQNLLLSVARITLP